MSQELARHKQEIYEVVSIFYNDQKINKTSFVLRLKTIGQLTNGKLKLNQAINSIFEIEHLKKCKTEKDISKYKREVRKELVEILKKLDIDVKYSELKSVRSKKYQEYIDERMKEFDEKRIKDENFKKLVKTLRENDDYLESNMFNAVLHTLNSMRVKNQSFNEAVTQTEARFKVNKEEVKKYVYMVKNESNGF